MPRRPPTATPSAAARPPPIDRRAPNIRAMARFPTRQEQAVQFLTRYLFIVLGLVFFNYASDFTPKWMPLWQVNLWLGVHLVVNTINFIHAWRKPVSPTRARFALWWDVISATICVANDPYDIPPSMMAYIIIVLGNGMRYGMRFFAEALLGSLIGGALAMTARYVHLPNVLSPGTVFLSLFGAIIVVYAYILMSRVEQARYRSEQVSRTDALTGLLNRRGLNEAADGWFSGPGLANRQLVVMFADLDNFKMVNDTRGHAEGDRALLQVAMRLQSCVRPTDFVARYGGDEFVILLPETALTEAEQIASRIQKLVGEWFAERGLSCGISIGVAAVPPTESDLGKVLASVDRLLYESKAGRVINGIRRIELV